MCDTETGSSIIMVHVDDMATAASNKVEVAKLKEELGNLFSLMDIGELKWLVGIAITHNQHAHTISLCQAAYIESIAKCLHLEDAPLVTMPLYPHVVLLKNLSPTHEEDKLWMKKILYFTVVGSIMYAATTTHPHITYTIQHLSQFDCNPGNVHELLHSASSGTYMLPGQDC